MSLCIGLQPTARERRGREMNSLIVEQIICLQIKSYLIAKSYGQEGESMRLWGTGNECLALYFVTTVCCFYPLLKQREGGKMELFNSEDCWAKCIFEKATKVWGKGSVRKPLQSEGSLTTRGHPLLANGACLFCLLEFKWEIETERRERERDTAVNLNKHNAFAWTCLSEVQFGLLSEPSPSFLEPFLLTQGEIT